MKPNFSFSLKIPEDGIWQVFHTCCSHRDFGSLCDLDHRTTMFLECLALGHVMPDLWGSALTCF